MINHWPDYRPEPHARPPTTALDTKADLEPVEMLSVLMAAIGQERKHHPKKRAAPRRPSSISLFAGGYALLSINFTPKFTASIR